VKSESSPRIYRRCPTCKAVSSSSYLVISILFLSSGGRRPTNRRPLSVAGWVHPVPEMQGLQVHHISREQRLVITGGRHSRLASKIELETDHLVVLLFLLSFLLVVMTAMWIVFRHYSKLCAFTSSPLSMNVLLAWSSGKHI
jgi:hypothetical protein